MLTEVFVQYITDIPVFRSENIDLDNVEFHKKNELKLKAPFQWNVRQCLIDAFKQNKIPFEFIFVFYSDTPCYRSFYNLINDTKDTMGFCSYYELHYAVMTSSQDIRPQQRIRSQASTASIIVVLEASRCSEIVLNAIRQFANGALILID